MSTINRFAQYSQPRYTPRSLQELMMVPAYKRQQHDSVQEGLAEFETQLAQVASLPVHDEFTRQRQQALYNELDRQATQLANNGFSTTSKSDFIRFNKAYQYEMGPQGNLGKVVQAKKQYDIEKAQYINGAIKAGFSPEAANKNWEDHSRAYTQGFDGQNITDISSLYSPTFKDPVTELRGLLKEAGLRESDISNINSYIVFDPGVGSYILNDKVRSGRSDNVRELQAAVDYINNQVNNPNSTIGKSIAHNRQTTDDVLREVAGLSDVYRKSSIIQDNAKQITNFKSAAELGVGTPMTNNLAYEATEAEVVKSKHVALNDALSDIATGNTINIYPDKYRASEVIIPQSVKEQATFQNRMSEQERKDYENLYGRLAEVNPALRNLDAYSQEAAGMVQEYLSQTENILRQNFVITDDYVTTYGDTSVGVDKTSPDKIGDLIKRSRNKRSYFYDGQVYPTYNDLPKEVKEKFDDIQYSGFYSPKNFMTDEYGEFQNRKLFVSPHEALIVDDKGNSKPLLVSRSEGEMQTPSFKADMLFNDVFVNTNKYPSLPYKIPGSSDVISYYPDGVPIPGVRKDKKYLVNKVDENGSYKNPQYISEEELQNIIYRGFNVMTPSEIEQHNKEIKKVK